MTLHKKSSVPLYQQLADEIKNQIETGVLKENDRLTESELIQSCHVSRITVRKAIDLLVDDEALIRKQGIGTFVASKKLKRQLNSFLGFSQSCAAEGKTAGAKLLSAQLINPSASDSKYLNLTSGEKVINLERIRYCDGIPVMLEESHLPQKYAFLLTKDLELPLHELLAEFGIILASGTKKVGISYAGDFECEHLGVNKGAALLSIRDVNYDTEGDPVCVCYCAANPERYSLTFMG